MSTVVFYISKILRPILASPLFIALALILIALIALKSKTKFQRAVKCVSLIAITCLALLSEPFVATGLARLWEYPRTDPATLSSTKRYDAIVLLGGSIDAVTSKPGAIEGNDSFERVVTAAELYRSKLAPRVIVSGGSGSIAFPQAKEAPYSAEFLEFMGVPASAILIEDASRNTYENAVYTARLLARGIEDNTGSVAKGVAKSGIPSSSKTTSLGAVAGAVKSAAPRAPRIALITSAWHMRRAAAIFKKAGFDFDPISVDSLVHPFEMPADLFPDAWALTRSTRILHEIVGYVSYGLMGRL